MSKLSATESRCVEDLVRTETPARRWHERCDGDPRDPGPDGAWSVSEQVLHVIKTLESVAEEFEARSLTEEQSEGDRRHVPRLAVLTTWKIPLGKAQATPPVLPDVILGPDDLVPRLREARDALSRHVKGARGFGRGPRVIHPNLGAMNIVEWTRFLLIHALHHERILESRHQLLA